jgi:type 2A phosphatase activator TIP41
MAPHALDEDGRGISIAGWRVRATRAPIIGDAAVEAAARDLGGVLTVPEILFGNSRLELSHAASGVTLSFTALDALAAWRREGLPSLKVVVAQQWQAARREEIQRQQAVVLEYDWTYTTPYQGTLECTQSCVSVASQQQQQQQQQQGQQGLQEKQGAGQTLPQRIICTSLEGEQQSADAAAQALTAAEAAARPRHPMCQPRAAGSNASPAAPTDGATASAAAVSAAAAAPCDLPVWVPTLRQADRALLMSRDEPILFFAEVPLYESELDDNGCSQLVAKVRVMPRCWLVLLRFWLRVDGTMVRLRETRLFCR